MSEQNPQHGPKMMALPNDRWRQFVVEYIQRGRKNAKRAYMAAFPNASEATAGCNGVLMSHDVRVQEALLELSQKMLRLLAPSAIEVVTGIMEDEFASRADRLKASEMVMSRTGLNVVTENKTTVEHVGGDPEQLKRITALAVVLGISVEALLGKRLAAKQPVMIDITPERLLPDPLEGLRDLL